MSIPLAVEGGPPTRSTPFPLQQIPAPAADAAPLEALERELSALLGGERVAVACASHGDALTLALRAAGVEQGEVVAPALGGEAAARSMPGAGLRVVPAEVDAETANLAARGLAQAAGPQTRAVIVTHAFGHPAAMPDLLRLAQHHGLAVIEDVSESLGAAYRGRPTGALGNAAALGFGPGHLLTGDGAGGVVFVGDGALAERVRGWRDEAGGAPDEHVVRVALAELRGAEASLHARRQSAWRLTEQLRGVRGLAAMPHGRWVRHGYDRYVCRIRPLLWRRSLDETVAAIRAEGIPCAPGSGPSLHEDPAVRAALGEDDPRLQADRFVAASALPRELLSFPLSEPATAAHMDGVAEALRKVALASVMEARRR